MELRGNKNFMELDGKFVPNYDLTKRYVLNNLRGRGQQVDVDDLIQEASLACLNTDFPTLPETAKPETWFYSVVHNIVMAWRRKEYTRNHLSLEGINVPVWDEESSERELEREAAPKRLLLTDLLAITKLQRQELDAFLLGKDPKRGKSKSYARLLGTSVGAFYKRLSLARARLREIGRVNLDEDVEVRMCTHLGETLKAGGLGPAAAGVARDPNVNVEVKTRMALAEFYFDAMISAVAEQTDSWWVDFFCDKLNECYRGLSREVYDPLQTVWSASQYFNVPLTFISGVLGLHDYGPNLILFTNVKFMMLLRVSIREKVVDPLSSNPFLLALRAGRIIARLGWPGNAVSMFEAVIPRVEEESGGHQSMLRILDTTRKEFRAII